MPPPIIFPLAKPIGGLPAQGVGPLMHQLEVTAGRNIPGDPTQKFAFAEGDALAITDAVTRQGNFNRRTGARTVFALDSFNRVVGAGGLGTADTGGAWTADSNGSAQSVDGNNASITLVAGSAAQSSLQSVYSRDVAVTASFNLSAMPTGDTQQLIILLRMLSGTDKYEGIINVSASPPGLIYIDLWKKIASLETFIGEFGTGLTWAGQKILCEFEVLGANPTLFRGRVWFEGTAQPNWQVAYSDNEATLQKGGYVGLETYKNTGNTVTVLVDQFTVVGDAGNFLGISTDQYVANVLRIPSCVGLWVQDDTGTTGVDLKNARNGTYSGGYTHGVAMAITGRTGTTYNGSTGQLLIPDHSDYSVVTTGKLTLEVIATLTATTDRAIFGKCAAFNYEWSFVNGGTTPAYVYFVLYSFGGGGICTVDSITNNISLGVPHHFAITINYLAGVVRLFVDGVFRNSGTIVGTAIDGTAGITLGTRGDAQQWFDGPEQAFAVYNDILSDDQIRLNAVATTSGAFRTGSFGRTTANSLTITDAATRIGTWFRTAALTLTITDAATRLGTWLRTTADTLTISDAVTRIGQFFRGPADSLTITDAATQSKISGGINRTAADTLTITDAVTRVLVLGRTTANTLGITDAVTRIGTFGRTTADSLGITDAATRIGTFLRTAAQTLTITDAVTRLGTFLRTTADSLTITDAAVGSRTYLRSVADSLGITDAATRAGGFFRSTADSLGITDAVTRLLNLGRTASQTLTITDVANGSRTYFRSVADSLTISDSATRIVSLGRSLADSLGITDAATRTLALARSTANSITFGTVATRAITLVRTATQSLTITDVVTRNVALARRTFNSLTISDSVIAILKAIKFPWRSGSGGMRGTKTDDYPPTQTARK